MSISINPLTPVDVQPNETVEAQPNCVPVDLAPSSDVGINTRKKEYVVVNDGIFASATADEAPQWLMSLIGGVISNSLNTSLAALDNSNQNVLAALSQIEIANNNYNEVVNIDVRVDQAINSRVAQLDARINGSNALITQVDAARVAADQAFALSLSAVQTQLGENTSSVSGMQTTLNNLSQSLAQNTLLVTAKFEDVDAAVTRVEEAQTTAEEAIASTQETLTAGFTTVDGQINAATSTLNSKIIAAEDRVLSKFEYGSVIEIGGRYYEAGFGLIASAGEGEGLEEDTPHFSEFWINAQKFKFTNSAVSGAVAPFTIDASGLTPEITFNGKVSFSNVTNAPTTEQIVSGINAGTTTIHGSKITTGSLNANVIGAGVMYNAGADESNYTMKIDLNNGSIFIR